MQRRLTVLILALCSLANPWLSSSEAGRKYALVVGVKTYRPGQPLPELTFTENDADGLAEVLKAGGYDVTLMTQTVARTPGKEILAPLADYIRDQLTPLLDNPFLKDDDVVIIALTGHGVQYELDDGEKKIPRFYFCPADADVGKLKTAAEITDRHHLIDLGELYDLLKGCKAGGKLLLVDACRNDPTKPGVHRSLASNSLPPIQPPPGGTAVFFSCSAHQRSVEDPELKHGVFFHHVIEALRGEADTSTKNRPADGQITLAELSEYASGSTYDFVRKKYSGERQAPELKGEFRVSIPLISVLSVTPSSPPRMPVQPDQTPSASRADKLLTNSINMKLVRIPAGEFLMGSPDTDAEADDNEKPQHRVRITRDFYLGQTEVTQGQWQSVMGTEPWKGQDYVREGSDNPATYVSWEDASEFCRKLSAKEGKSYRLPTEAEWEYACRGGTQMRYSFGDEESRLDDYGWFTGNAWDVNETYAHRVGQKQANPFGLYDMHGNVWEWCSDWYDPSFYGQSRVDDPAGLLKGSLRVRRGGSWGLTAGHCRSASRSRSGPSYYRDSLLGFRVALSPSGE